VIVLIIGARLIHGGIAMSNLSVAANIAGINAHRALRLIDERGRKASEKLSSGYRINRAADDAAGLAISEKIKYQIRGLNQALMNISDAYTF
jgi:flagellin